MVDQPEHRLSHHLDQMLERILLEPCWFTAIDHAARPMGKSDEDRRRSVIFWENARKYRGVKPSQLDWNIEQKVENSDFWRIAKIELKYGRNSTDHGQDVTIRLLTDRDIPNAVGRSLLEVHDFLMACGFRLHGNAANIAAECEMRWRAADEEMRGTVKVKKTYKPRVKADPSKIRKIEKIRASGIRF